MDVFTRDNEECTAFVFSMTAGYLKPLQVDPFVCDLHNVGYTIYLDATSTVFFVFFHAFPVTPKECCIMPLYSQEWGGGETPLPGAKYCFVVRYVKFWLMEMQNY